MTQERAPERERPQLERSLARLPGRWQKTVSRIPRNRERAGSRRIHSARNRRVLLDLTVVPVSDSSSLFRLAGPLHRTQATLQAAAPRPAPRPPIPRPSAPRRRSCRPCRAVRPCRSSPAQRSATPSGRLRVLARATLFLAVERHQMERRGLPEHLRHRVGGTGPVAPVLLQVALMSGWSSDNARSARLLGAQQTLTCCDHR